MIYIRVIYRRFGQQDDSEASNNRQSAIERAEQHVEKMLQDKEESWCERRTFNEAHQLRVGFVC